MPEKKARLRGDGINRLQEGRQINTGRRLVEKTRAKIEGSGKNRIAKIAVTFIVMAVMAALPFFSAGTTDYPGAWLFFIVLTCTALTFVLFIAIKRPEALIARADIGKNIKGWDKVIVAAYVIAFLSIFLVAGLDFRYKWSLPPAEFTIIGLILSVPAISLYCWAMYSNTSAAATVKVKKGQQVVSIGPYAIIRHPMYAGYILLWIATPLILGSLYALIPGAMTGLALVARIPLEEKALHKELKGYAEYTKKVKYRLVPYVW